MPSYLSPGVYVEEVDSGARPIEGVGTAVAAFIGLAADGPTNEPVLVTNWTQFTDTFGDFTEGGYLAHAVYGYFLNGGGSAYVVRVGANGKVPAAPSARGELVAGGDARVGAYKITALATGPSGNDISVEVTIPDDSPEDVFKLIVRGGGGKVEEFEGLTTKRGRQSAQTVVNARSELIRLEETSPSPRKTKRGDDLALGWEPPASGGAGATVASGLRWRPF